MSGIVLGNAYASESQTVADARPAFVVDGGPVVQVEEREIPCRAVAVQRDDVAGPAGPAQRERGFIADVVVTVRENRRSYANKRPGHAFSSNRCISQSLWGPASATADDPATDGVDGADASCASMMSAYPLATTRRRRR